jgi:hypothetical protein
MKNAQHYWSKHLAAIKSQGVTTSAYARQHRLALASLYYWERKLRAAAATTAVITVAPTGAARPPSKFITLSVSDPIHQARHPGTHCTLVLAGGVHLEMSALPDPQWLVAVVRSALGAC